MGEQDGPFGASRPARDLEEPLATVLLGEVELQVVGEREHVEPVGVLARGGAEREEHRFDGPSRQRLVDGDAHLVDGVKQHALAVGDLAVGDRVAVRTTSAGRAPCDRMLKSWERNPTPAGVSRLQPLPCMKTQLFLGDNEIL